MKKTIISLIILLCVSLQTSFGSSIPCDQLPQKIFPPVAVSDFAGIIQEPEKASLEQKLQKYWNTTAFSVVVVTVPTLNGEDDFNFGYSLFNCWGIGDKTKRGILLLVAPTEHKVRIHTGYGLEGILPDALCKRIIEQDIIPRFKEGQPTQAISAGVQAIMNVLGTMSPEEREKGDRERQALEKKQTEEVSEFLEEMSMVFGITFFALIVLAVCMRIYSNRKKRTALKKQNNFVLSDIKHGEEMLAGVKKMYEDNAPAWALEEMQAHLNACTANLSKAKNDIASSNKNMGGDLQQARQNTDVAWRLVQNAVQSFQKIDGSLKEKVKKFSDEVNGKFTASVALLQKTNDTVREYVKEGFKFTERKQKIEALVKNLESRSGDLQNKEFHKELYELADMSVKKGFELLESITGTVKTRNVVEMKLPIVVKEINDDFTKHLLYKDMLEGLKQAYPKTVWLPLETSFLKLIKLISPEEVQKVAKQIVVNNSMSVQQFEKASDDCNDLETLCSKTGNLFVLIEKTKEDQERAKKDFPEKKKSVEEDVKKALEVIKDSNVNKKAKDLAKQASAWFKDVMHDTAAGFTLLDWVMLLSLLHQVERDAWDSIKLAEADIENAQNKRLKDAADAAAAKKKAEDQSYYQSPPINSDYSGSIFSSDGGGGGFGGFGGGTTGGGGAGGSW